MKIKTTLGRKAFLTVDYVILAFAALSCLLPLLHILAVSFSSKWAASAGVVILWPVQFTMQSYKFTMQNREFLTSITVSVKRVALGFAVNMLLVILTAYPLSKETKSFKSRTAYTWFFIITMLFSGGLIPWYMTIRLVGLIDTIWALVLPGAVQVFSVVILMNFFRQLPKELEEAAFIDGASHWTCLWRIYVPLSLPALATLTLFSIVGHWNSWFDGLILMNQPEHYPLQSFLQSTIIETNAKLSGTVDTKTLQLVDDRTSKAAQIFIATLPVLCIYPFLQKYFVKGMVLGSVKG